MRNIFLNAKNEISKNINASKKLDEPFEHCVVDNFLPKNIIDAIDLYWPSEVMIPIPKTGRTKKYFERKWLQHFEINNIISCSRNGN